MAVSQLFLVSDANYFASILPFLGCLAVPSNLRWCLLPERPAAPSPRSLRHPPPWYPGKKHKGHWIKYQSWEKAWMPVVETGRTRKTTVARLSEGRADAATEQTAAPGNSLVVRWLGLCTLTASGRGSILGWGTKMPQAAGCSHAHTEDHSIYFAGNHRVPTIGFSLSLECGPNRAVLRISRPAVARTFRLFKRTQNLILEQNLSSFKC